jgi:quinohemoprotein ethanol dehydrogenase
MMFSRHAARWLVLVAVIAVGALTAASPRSAGNEPYSGKEWTAPGGDWGSTRYSTLAQINARNIKQLGGAWVVGTPDRAEATPMVKDGRMFVVTTAGIIMALDPATGATLWTFTPEMPFSGKRGIGIGDGLLFAGLRNSNVMAISQETGKLVWTSEHAKEIPSQGMATAPAFGGGVVVGVVSLGDNFLHGRAIGYDAKTGKFLWSFDVVPGPGEPGHETWPQDSDVWKYGGGAIWTTPSVDEELGLVYLPTGNAVPQYGGELRPGNNLFDNSVVALDIKTGKMRWYFQAVHHDIWEADLSTPLVMYDATFGGRSRKALAAMRTDGILFILDRETGKPLVPVEERPVRQDAFLKTSPTQPFTKGGERVGPGCVEKDMIPPGFIAGCYFDPISTDRPNQYLPHMNMRQTPMAYSPQTNYLYAVACVNPAWMQRASTGWEFVRPTRLPGQKQYGVLAAIDARTAKIAWQKRLPYSECEGSGGALATAGGLMFHSEPDGVFQAYDAKTGDQLWRFQTGELGLGGGAGPSGAAAMTYESRGEQFVALANNRAVWAFKIGGTVPPRPAPPPPEITREWAGRIADASAIQLGTVTTFNIASANKKIDWADDNGLSPSRVRTKAGMPVTFKNTSKVSHTIAARDGSWSTGVIQPGASGSATITKPGTYEYTCTEHPWTIGQLIVE